MRYAKAILALLALLTLCVLPALAQDDIMFLNSKPLGPHERPLVKFSHAKHSVNIQCQTCHHDYDQYFNLTSSEGMACHDCHKVTPTPKNRVSLTMAFHKQCKNCHHLATKKGKPSPVMCGDCHNRELASAAEMAKLKKAK